MVGCVQVVVYSTVDGGQWWWKTGNMQEVVDGWLCSSGGVQYSGWWTVVVENR